jgi:hypothetical protein
MSEHADIVHAAAREAYTAGLCTIPPAEDGTKRPLPNAKGQWDKFKTARPSIEELRSWYPGRGGLGIVTGAVSGRVECWDFDDRPVYEAFRAAAAECGLGGVVAQIEEGYADDTPGGGVRWLVRYPSTVEREPVGIKLARRPKVEAEKKHPGDKIKTLIELPAFAITAPSNGTVHETGKPYVRRSGSFTTIESYTAEERDALIELARSFDAMPRHAAGPSEPRQSTDGERPGDDYARRTSWPEILEPHGWAPLFERGGVTHWRRPGKNIGQSATTNYGGSDLLYVFTSSTGFDQSKSYSKFAAFAVLEHGGDFKAAASALGWQGYGQQERRHSEPNRAERRAPQSAVRHLVSTRLSDVRMRPIKWVWFGRVAVGKHTTFAGEPSVGKSTVLYWIAATITRGGQWPCGEGLAPKGSVIILSAEDGAEDTIKPRVLAAGGDPGKVHLITATRDDTGKVSAFTLSADLQALERMIDEIGDVALVVIDPISSYLGGKVDGHSNTDVRSVVEPLHEMADRKKVAILTNSHFSKAGAANKSRASHRFIGSIAFVALPRVAFAVVVDPKDESRRLILHVKNNIAPAAKGLAFRLVQAKAGDIDTPPCELYASCVEWEGEHIATTADQAIAEHEGKLRGDASERRRKRASPERDEAEAFLRAYLADGPKPAKEVTDAARAATVAAKPLREAREALVETVQERSDDGKVIKGFIWRLKPEATTPGGKD